MKSIILHDFEVRNALKNDVIQIRRPVNPAPLPKHLYWEEFKKGIVAFDNGETGELRKCPFGEVGNPLWVKETWQAISPDENYRPLEECDIIYSASDCHPGFLASEYRMHHCLKNEDGADMVYPWKSSVHMPQWVSRLTIVLEEIWVELVQDITEEDAMDEGVDPEFEMSVEEFYNKRISPNSTYRLGFKHTWNSLYAKKGFGWEKNLPVWAGKFKVVERK